MDFGCVVLKPDFLNNGHISDQLIAGFVQNYFVPMRSFMEGEMWQRKYFGPIDFRNEPFSSEIIFPVVLQALSRPMLMSSNP